MSTPRTDNTLEKLLDQRGTIGRHNCPEELVVLSRKLERELAAANARIRRLEEALDLTSSQCGDLHHPKGHQHALGQPCPVEEIVRKAKEATR